MSGEVKCPRRRYHSPLRADQARQTRQRVLEAAFDLFAEHGYAGTTIAAVAEQAGVSPETIYLTVGSKRGLLEGAIETTIAGDGDPAAQEDGLWAEIAELPSAPERLAMMVDYSCAILARTRPIHTVIRGAADKEAFAATLSSRLLKDRLKAQTERIRRHLGDDLLEGPIGNRGRRALLRSRRPCSFLQPHRRARLDSRSAQELAQQPSRDRTARTAALSTRQQVRETALGNSGRQTPTANQSAVDWQSTSCGVATTFFPELAALLETERPREAAGRSKSL